MTTINNLTKHDSREFKVGDFVVLNVGRWVYKIDHIYHKAVWLDREKPQLDIVNIDDVLRHATPSEIKVGHRIDDNTDHVTDIRNHVSPSTKVIDHG